MYFPYFVTYISIGLVISIVVFIWALKNGQFRDQQRARFLPLEELDQSAGGTSRISRYEIYALFFLALAGIGASAAVLIYSIFCAP